MAKFTTPSAAGAEVDRRAEAYMSEHQGVSYKEALHAVLAADKQLAASYAAPAARTMATKPVPVPAPVLAQVGMTPGEVVHLLTVELMDLTPSMSYQTAMRRLLAADANLKTAYARS